METGEKITLRVYGKDGDRRESGLSEQLQKITKRLRVKHHLQFKHLRENLLRLLPSHTMSYCNNGRRQLLNYV